MASTSNSPTLFPGHVLIAGTQGEMVRAIQQRLNQLGCGPVLEDGVFGAETADAVELFQARSLDKFGSPLQVDGVVGPMTWGALFGAATVPTIQVAETPLLKRVLEIAASQVGVLEEPTGSNRGPQIDEYLRCVGIDPACGCNPWCAAFVYWCFHEAAAELGVANPAVQTGGVLDMWTRAGSSGVKRISSVEALAQPSLVRPGCVFVLSTGSGNGHTGLVEWTDGDRLATIEGNTNEKGGREGIGVFRRTGRMMSNINRGFILY
jgi:putative peptidoglycan binding protein/CHAP domain-containing protein